MKLLQQRDFISILSATASLSILSLGSDARSATINANCTPTKTMVRVVEDVVQTTTQSTIYATVPSSKMAFTTTSTGCVLVRFSAEASGGIIDNKLHVQAMLDGKLLGSPPDTVFAGLDKLDDTPLTVHSMEYLFVNVPAGSHFVVMRWMQYGGALAYLGKRTMVVQFQ